jgi:hypothetical protein
VDIQIERNGIFSARFLACGYSQVPGIDFNEIFAPFLNDVSFRVILTAKLVWAMTCNAADDETAFLYGDLDEEIYMKVSKCLTIGENKKLTKC